MTLAIENVPWSDLKPHPQNPRNGDTDAIAESVRVNGVYRPVIVARDTILAGHHLYHALGELGHETVDIVRLDIDPNSAEALRIMVADNRTADLGRYDDALLVEALSLLDHTDEQLLGTGYTDEAFAALNALVSSFDMPEAPEDQPRLDQRESTTCPSCGYEWRVGPGGTVEAV